MLISHVTREAKEFSRSFRLLLRFRVFSSLPRCPVAPLPLLFLHSGARLMLRDRDDSIIFGPHHGFAFINEALGGALKFVSMLLAPPHLPSVCVRVCVCSCEGCCYSRRSSGQQASWCSVSLLLGCARMAIPFDRSCDRWSEVVWLAYGQAPREKRVTPQGGHQNVKEGIENRKFKSKNPPRDGLRWIVVVRDT